MLGDIMRILPALLKEELNSFGSKDGINEIRLRAGKKTILITSKTEIGLNYVVSLRDLLEILIKISQNSLYAIQNDINNGFVTINGGHRVGVCGEVVIENSKIKNIKNINSMNIRVARQMIGSADKIMPSIISYGIKNTLIISPPGCGKTTMLRDAVRQLSSGVPRLGFDGVNVGLVDERGELAAVTNGKSALDVGIRTDIISGCPKSIGIDLLIRSMGVQVIATDEIGKKSDIESIKSAALSGVKLIFTMHGNSVEDVYKKEGISELINQRYFDNIVILSNRNGPGTIENVHKINEVEVV